MESAAQVMPETQGNIIRPIISVSHLSKKYCRDLRRSLWYGLCDVEWE